MRPLEIVIPLLLAMYLLWPRRSWVRFFPGLALLVVIVHLLLEGYRWQMIPLYTLTAVLAIVSLIKIHPSSRWRSITTFFTLLLLGAAIALPILLPVPSIPPPSGPYQVGTRTYELTDSSRRELYSGREEARRFQIQVWYPSEPGPSAEHAPWMANADRVAPAIASYIGMPSFFLDHLRLVEMPAYQDSPLAPKEEGYPVILFSHGWNGFNAQNTGQAVHLASHGYVVVGVQHTYGAVITVFEDGTIAYNNPSALPSSAPDDEYEAAAQVLARQWAGDLAYALDFMQVLNADASGAFAGSLDLARVGAYGHSTGGGAVIQFCGTDSRCKALLGMDPFMRPVSAGVLESGVSQPAFFMFSQVWTDDVDSQNNALFRRFASNAPQTLGVVSIDGTAHYDFSDIPLLSPLAPRLGLKGPIDGQRITAILDDYLLSFFDATLKDIPTSLFEGTNQKYNEVRGRK